MKFFVRGVILVIFFNTTTLQVPVTLLGYLQCVLTLLLLDLQTMSLNRNQYDGDITTWSPQGRLFQVEYAMEAVKQGSTCVGLKSKMHAVICAVKRSSSELSSYQRKVFKLDDHMGIAISGLTADARSLSRYMRNECMNHRYVYETPMSVSRLVAHVADSILILRNFMRS